MFCLFTKKSSKQYADNYRPVSLLCILGKIFERIIFKHVHNHLHENKLLSTWQSVFFPGSSTVTQLLELCHKFSSALDERMDVHVVYLDISKAFDKVWHKGLLFKLKQFGIQGNMLRWFSSYSPTCSSNHLRRATTCKEQPPWKTTKAFYINLNLRRATTCNQQPPFLCTTGALNLSAIPL